MTILVMLLLFYLALNVGLYKIFEKTGKDPKKAFIPGVNFMEWADLIGKPRKKLWWLLVPIVNIFSFVGMAIDMVRSFGKLKFKNSVLASIFTPICFFLLGTKKEEKYRGPVLTDEAAYQAKIEAAREEGKKALYAKLVRQNPYKKSVTREWTEAIIFAVFAAHFIRMFFIEAYTIPTSSMEGSLLVGDFLFVSKMHYGIRTPKTIFSFPLLHNRLPFNIGESYLSKPNLPLTRLPALTDIHHNDPVVFNYPEGDSVYLTPSRAFSVYDVRIEPRLKSLIRNKPLIVRPLDKMDHYIKRCIGLPGETIEVKNKQVYIDGKPAENPKNLQYEYLVQFQGKLNISKFDDWGISREDIRESGQGYMALILSEDQKKKVQALDKSIKISPIDRSEKMNNPRKLFPHAPAITKGWSNDNYGPVHIPKAGETIDLNMSNLPFYERVIQVYEHNKLYVHNGKIFINGKEATQYTFKLNYYWMMGDNRHNSEDSRYWGFVPQTHVVGKPLFIWFSTKDGSISNGIRWNRLFTGATKMD